jgi:MSHA biogenesis protein MshQ
MRPLRQKSARRWLVLFLFTLATASTVYGAGTFGYRQQITLTGVVGGPHADFPVLISLLDPNLRTLGNGGHVASANGYDIVFTASDGTTPLDHEIERWNGATGELVAWVRVPTLAAGTLIYLYYGNNLILSATETPGAVWEDSYVGVWHLKEAGNGTIRFSDSSRYGNTVAEGKGQPTKLPHRWPEPSAAGFTSIMPTAPMISSMAATTGL